MYISSTVIALLCSLMGTDILQSSHWNPKLLLKCFANHAKYMLFLSSGNDRVMTFAEELSPTEVVMACLYGASHFFRRIVGLYENMLTAVGPFTLWVAVNEFISSLDLNEFPTSCWQTVYRRYTELLKLTDIVNTAFGPMFISHFFTAFFFYSCNLDKLITTTDWIIRMKFLVYYLIFILTLLFASDVCKQVV